MIEAQLRGQFPPGYRSNKRINLSELIRSGTGKPPQHPPTRIADARALQARAPSEAGFFEEHGFILLDAPTHIHLAYRPGVPLINTVWQAGQRT